MLLLTSMMFLNSFPSSQGCCGRETRCSTVSSHSHYDRILHIGDRIARAGPRGCLNTPLYITRPLCHVATRGKRHSKKRQNHDGTGTANFMVRSKVRSPELTKGQILPFSTIFYESAHNSGPEEIQRPGKAHTIAILTLFR